MKAIRKTEVDSWLASQVKRLSKDMKFIGYYELKGGRKLCENYPKGLYACFEDMNKNIFVCEKSFWLFHNTLGLDKDDRCYWEETDCDNLNLGNMEEVKIVGFEI